ncbi:hypothetical protein CICLE_v100327302mg, partial [Citrus x clementina]
METGIAFTWISALM